MQPKSFFGLFATFSLHEAHTATAIPAYTYLLFESLPVSALNDTP